jgi:hypothetical protein
MSPFAVLHGFEPDLPSPLRFEPANYSYEDFEEQVLRSPQDIVIFFSSLHEKLA